MAKTALQRKHESLERKRLALEMMPESTRGLADQPFFEFYKEHGNSSIVDAALDTAGMDWLNLTDESDPKSFTGDVDFDYSKYPGSIGRAEIYVSMWLEAALALAQLINEYKKEAVEKALADLEQADLSDPAVRKKALAESARLHKIRESLDKVSRLPIPAYEIKGI